MQEIKQMLLPKDGRMKPNSRETETLFLIHTHTVYKLTLTEAVCKDIKLPRTCYTAFLNALRLINL